MKKKKFNTAGVCFPDLHYMMDNSRQVNAAQKMVEEGDYFTINRPRQYGKTTTLHALAERLQNMEDYLPIKLNFQGIDEKWYASDSALAQMFFQQINRYFEYRSTEWHQFLQSYADRVKDMNMLSDFITRMVHRSTKKVVLLVDEVDASSNYKSFLSLLGMLRSKYLNRRSPEDATFYSVVLAGVHDVKNLKFKLRNPEEAQYDSPWNIATNFDVEMTFQMKAIETMLEEYSKAEKVDMEISVIAERLYFYTSGYPFLVSRLCEMIAETFLNQKEDKLWKTEDIDKAVQLLLNEENTNFGSLIKNINNHSDLYGLILRILMNGEEIGFNPDNPDNTIIQKGITYSIFKRNGMIRIQNRVYEQRIYNLLSSNIETDMSSESAPSNEQFRLPNNALDVEKILHKFQLFLREEYSKKDKNFLERHWRLLFLAFLRPIVNGEGYTFKEVQISAEKRLDVVITYFQHRYVVELKRWYGEKYHQKGIAQLADYLERQHVKKGFLIIFGQKGKEKASRWISYDNKRIFVLWI
ncbi:MAG: AAA-like domain-containing protein [Bacteroidota bacterium]